MRLNFALGRVAILRALFVIVLVILGSILVFGLLLSDSRLLPIGW